MTPPLLTLVTTSLGTLVVVVAAVLEINGFAVLWLPAGSVLLLDGSSGFVPVSAGAAGEALLVAPLFSMFPSAEELRLVGNPLTGSFEAVGGVGRPTDPNAGC